MTAPESARAMQWLELKIPPVAIVALVAAAMWLAARFGIGPGLRFAGQGPLAALLLAAGAALATAGIVAFRRARTTVDPRDPSRASQLVTGGVYRYSRNPMYAGLLLALAAWALWLGNAAALAGLPVFVAWMNRFQIAPEERALRARFGAAFVAFERSVRRWL